eukprot:3391889-Pyramimonas_sp.AAC.1
MVEIEQPGPTRFSLANHSTNIIDGMASVPGWGIVQLNALGITKDPVEDLHHRCLSDRAPVSAGRRSARPWGPSPGAPHPS